MAVALLAPDSPGENPPRDGVRMHCAVSKILMGLPAAAPAQQVQILTSPLLPRFRYACTVINIIPNTVIITHLELIMWNNFNNG